MSIHRPKSKCLKVTKVYPKVIAHISFIFHICRPDALHWLGITKIHKFISMSDMKYDAIINSGIKIVERIPIPPELIPKDAQVEIAAKVIVTVNHIHQYRQNADKVIFRRYVLFFNQFFKIFNYTPDCSSKIKQSFFIQQF